MIQSFTFSCRIIVILTFLALNHLKLTHLTYFNLNQLPFFPLNPLHIPYLPLYPLISLPLNPQPLTHFGLDRLLKCDSLLYLTDFSP